MNVREVFCDYCYKWKKREDLVEALNRGGELYCKECEAVLIRTDDYNPKKEIKYTIRAKGIDHRFNWLMRDEQSGEYVFGSSKKPSCQLIFTEKELARDDMSYVLYNDAFEVEEVKRVITTQTTLAEVFKIMTDSCVNIINIDLDVDDVPVRLKIKLTARGYEAEWKEWLD